MNWKEDWELCQCKKCIKARQIVDSPTLHNRWNSEADELSTNMLINYIYRPGSDIYLVVNQSYNSDDADFHHQETTVIAKITFWWNP